MKNEKIRNAVWMGGLCAISYLAVYFARNIMGAVSPKMIESGDFTMESIGTISSVYFIVYAVGQLINGAIGEYVKARWMISGGLLLAGVCNACFVWADGGLVGACIAYGLTGYFLSTVYGPMTKVLSENVEPRYVTRCTLGYTFSSLFGVPLAGVAAAALTWQGTFYSSSLFLLVMGAACFAALLVMERKGIVRYGQYQRAKGGGSIRQLVRLHIVPVTGINILIGVVRTAVIFWLPTYMTQYLGFSAEGAATTFTATTFLISLTPLITVFAYEKMGSAMFRTTFWSLVISTAAFALAFAVKQPAINVAGMVIAIMGANGASTMIVNRYCPGLRDTGMVSGVSGFLDACGYAAASVSTAVFPRVVEDAGWGVLILAWMVLMLLGTVLAIPLLKAERRS